MKKFLSIALAAGLAVFGGVSHAATNTYTSQPAFQALMDTSFGVVDTSANIGQTTETLSTFFSDADFFTTPSSSVRSDGVLLNGQFFLGPTNPSLGLNFGAGVNGVGAFANPGDGGRILIYDDFDGTGTLLGQVGYSATFGAITSDTLIKSAVFTCEFNGDLACGLIDPQWGTGSSFAAPVPLPAAGGMLLAGLGGLLALRRRRRV